MQKYRFIFGVTSTLLIFICSAISQDIDIYQLYSTQQFSEIEKQFSAGSIADEKWQKFAEILFMENLDEALSQYISLYNAYNDERLHRVIIDRISQYYYARGLYDSADRILKDPEFRQKIFAMNTEKISFGVQLGAFSTMENAKKAKNKYSKNIDDIRIINKQSGGKRLYVVVAGNYGNRADAENFKKVILKKYSYSGMVIQY
jgi:hypothetical protein